MGVARVTLMFSVVTLTLASPVYLRVWESPGLGGLFRLVLLLQVLPAVGLVLIDVWLARRAPGTRWRSALCIVCLLSVARQAQVSFRLPIESTTSVLLAVCSVVGLGMLVIRGLSVIQRGFARTVGGSAWVIVVWPVVR